MDYYSVLGVHPSAEDVVIRAAYKALAQRYHPDRFAGSKDEAHRRMSELSIAYEVLANPVLRPKYDRRRFITQSIASAFNSSARYGSSALGPGETRSAEPWRGRLRVALAALLSVVVILSAFNLFHYSARLKEWLGTSTAKTSSVPVGQGPATTLETAVPKAQPAPPADPSTAPAVESSAGAPSVKEKTRAGTRTAASNNPAKSVPMAVQDKAKPKAPPPGTCSQQEQLLGLCK